MSYILTKIVCCCILFGHKKKWDKIILLQFVSFINLMSVSGSVDSGYRFYGYRLTFWQVGGI